MRSSLIALALVGALASCAVLDKTIDVITPDGEVETTTVGDLVADNSEGISGAVEGIVGTVTGNPMAAGGAAALAAVLLGRARRRKKAAVVAEEPKDTPEA
jgi:MYXO-CTERM domain-containing protein